jgi:hypothetical protein
LSLLEDSLVYVCYDNRGKDLPSWLQDWTLTEEAIRTTDSEASPMVVLSRTVAGGEEITLGGNHHGGNTGAESNYFVIAQPIDECIDTDGDGWGYPGHASCPSGPEEDCDDDPSDDPAEADDPSHCPIHGGSCVCGEKSCAGCAECIHPGAQELIGDGIDSNCRWGDSCATMVFEAPATWGNIAVNLGVYLVPVGGLILGLRRRYRRQ